jgi:hypothetical protein
MAPSAKKYAVDAPYRKVGPDTPSPDCLFMVHLSNSKAAAAAAAPHDVSVCLPSHCTCTPRTSAAACPRPARRAPPAPRPAPSPQRPSPRALLVAAGQGPTWRPLSPLTGQLRCGAVVAVGLSLEPMSGLTFHLPASRLRRSLA